MQDLRDGGEERVKVVERRGQYVQQERGDDKRGEEGKERAGEGRGERRQQWEAT